MTIEHRALLADIRTFARVGRNGPVDGPFVPRFRRPAHVALVHGARNRTEHGPADPRSPRCG